MCFYNLGWNIYILFLVTPIQTLHLPVFLFQEIAAHPKFTADGFSRFDLLQGKLGKYNVMHMHFKCQVITFA